MWRRRVRAKRAYGQVRRVSGARIRGPSRGIVPAHRRHLLLFLRGWNALVRSGVVSRSSPLSGLAPRSSVLVQGAVREGRGRVGRKRVVGKGALWDVRACTSLFGRGDDPRAQAPAGLLRAQLPQRRSALFRCLVRLSHPSTYARHSNNAIVTPRLPLFLVFCAAFLRKSVPSEVRPTISQISPKCLPRQTLRLRTRGTYILGLPST